MRITSLLVASAVLAACAMPSTTVRTSDTRPALAIANAPGGALLFVDRQAVGEANAFDGHPNTLRVEPGTHELEIRDPAGKVIFRQRVFVESELKTVEVH
jgi:hypothetical protein